MPISITNTAATGTYASPFVGSKSGPMHVQVDVSALTTREVDARGYLKPGVVLTSAGLLPGVSNTAVVGVVPEAVKIADSNTGLGSITADPFVVIYTIGMVNRDVIEDNLESAMSANEIAALNTAPSRIVLTLT